MGLILTGIAVFGPGRPLLNGVSLSFAEAGITALIGPNGAGKSTLLRVMAGVRAPDGGTITWDGQARLPRGRLAYLPQQTPMPFGYTVTELVGLSGGSESGRKAAMEGMELGPLRDMAVDRLSGGERQRAAIARALAQGAPLTLLDEPFVSLDLRYQRRLEASLRSRARSGDRLIVALHDLDQARRLADRVVVLSQGDLADDGPPDTVLTPTLLRRVFGVEDVVETAP